MSNIFLCTVSSCMSVSEVTSIVHNSTEMYHLCVCLPIHPNKEAIWLYAELFVGMC